MFGIIPYGPRRRRGYYTYYSPVSLQHGHNNGGSLIPV